MTLLSTKTVRRHFARAARQYAEAAVLQTEVLQRLLSRLDFMKIKPQRILDCGARQGLSTKLLRQRFPKAEVIAYECSEYFLKQHEQRWYQRRSKRVCGDYCRLPFANGQFDLIFSNLSLHWGNDLAQMLLDFFRVLKPGGLFLFTTVGPDTLKEWRAVFATQAAAAHLHDFIDMHDIGDLLVKTRFLDPVMDMEYLQMRYDSVSHLIADLKATGVTNARADRAKGLLGKNRWKMLLKEYQARWSLLDGVIPATVEVIYGHAWMPLTVDLAQENAAGEVCIPVSVLKK